MLWSEREKKINDVNFFSRSRQNMLFIFAASEPLPMHAEKIVGADGVEQTTRLRAPPPAAAELKCFDGVPQAVNKHTDKHTHTRIVIYAAKGALRGDTLLWNFSLAVDGAFFCVFAARDFSSYDTG